MQIEVSGITMIVEKKNIKNLYLNVHPPDGRVTITAPKRIKNEEIISFVQKKIEWINEKQNKFKSMPIHKENQYITGESIDLWGKKYSLLVTDSSMKSDIRLINHKVHLYVKENSTVIQRENLIIQWYRKQLKEEIPQYIEKWEHKMGVKVNAFGVKNMKTRWGTCNTRDKRIWINLQLIKKKTKCLEYIIVHEMTHLLEPSHNKNFVGYMDTFLPDWRERKEELNRIN